MGKLTPKQDHFARVYVETGNASEAYRQAYDVGENTTPEAVWVNACKNLANAKVAQRVAELQMKAQERTLVTVQSISEELDENRRLAKDTDQIGAMNTATMGKAKLHGLLVDKVESKDTVTIRLAADVDEI